MGFNSFKQSKTFKIISNRYFIILLIYIIWMVFFDENSFLIHRKINKEINQLETDINYYKKEIELDKKIIKDLEDPDKLEKFARENYKMKKKNEDIYIIEYDTLK